MMCLVCAVSFTESAICAGDMTGCRKTATCPIAPLAYVYAAELCYLFKSFGSLLDLPVLSCLDPKRLLLAEANTLHTVQSQSSLRNKTYVWQHFLIQHHIA
jgi:hypothetical protein